MSPHIAAVPPFSSSADVVLRLEVGYYPQILLRSGSCSGEKREEGEQFVLYRSCHMLGPGCACPLHSSPMSLSFYVLFVTLLSLRRRLFLCARWVIFLFWSFGRIWVAAMGVFVCLWCRWVSFA
jgi:hypothetical protein